MSERRWLRTGLWVLALAAVWWALRAVPLAEIWLVLRRLTPWQLAVLVSANGLIVLLLPARWRVILQTQGQNVRYGRLVGYRLAAFAVSYFTPGPQFGGEPLQVHLPRKFEGVPGSTATAAVALDKTLELLANFAVLALGALAVLRLELAPAGGDRRLLGIALALLALPLAYLLAAARGIRPLSLLLDHFSGSDRPARLARVAQIVGGSERQISEFCRTQPRALLAALAFSALTWAAMLAEYWLMARFLGLTFTPMQALAALTAARFAFLLPLPGGLGVLEASQVLAVSALGFDPAAGAALALLIRARDVALGLLGLWLGGRYLR